MPPKRPASPVKAVKREGRFKLPSQINLPVDVHTKWRHMFKAAEQLFESDYDLQKKSAKGLRLPGRNMPPEILGRLYAQYCELINQMYDAYLLSLQLQRNEYIKEIVSILVKRMYELRDELVHVIVNDYIYVDTALLQMLKTPFDIEIVVPYHFAKDSREESIENMLQKMWADAIKRKQNAERRLRKQMQKPKQIISDTSIGGEDKPKDKGEGEEDEEEDDSSKESEGTIYSEEYLNAVMIQKHVRYRFYYVRAYKARCDHRRTYFASKVEPPPKKLMEKAARLIQKLYRLFMQVKRQRLLDYKRQVLLGMVPDVDARPHTLREMREKLYERRRQTKKKIQSKYLDEWEKQKTLLILVKKSGMIEDITDEVIQWFKEWYYGYGFMPQYPYEAEDGTVVLLRGDYPTIQEKMEADEAYRKMFKNKTPDQLANERRQAQEDAKLKAEQELEKKKALKIALFKARCNPDTDMGYQVHQSANNRSILEALRRYRQSWSLYDKMPVERCAEIVHGYMKPLLIEDLMQEMHYECRQYVDALMRLEQKVFIKAHQAMYKRMDWPWPKMPPRPKPKNKPKPPKPLDIENVNMKTIEKLFDLGIVTKPTTKLEDVIGDLRYGNYEANIHDPLAKYPSPGYADVKRRLILSCVFGSGIEPNADRKKSVMLLGIPRNGKSFLVDAVAGELNAVKFDISPEVFSAVVEDPKKLLSSVFTAARIYQPSVIFFKNIERVFYKTVPPEEKELKANIIKQPLMKLLKTIPTTEKVIFIATCSQPWLATVPPMMKMFDEILLVPKPDYNSLQHFFYWTIQKMRSMPRDICLQPLAQSLNGIGFGIIREMFHRVLNPKRIVRLGAEPFEFSEFLEYLIANDVEPLTDIEYEKYMALAVMYSPLKAERAEYEVINASRAYAYEKLEAKKKADEAKKAADKK